MLVTAVRKLVELCSRYAWAVVIAAAVIAGGSGVYAAKHFAITTDVNNLLAPNLEWRKAFEAAFPSSVNSILVVIDAPTPELATEAASLLADKLEKQPALFKSVKPLDGDAFFAKNGLLFQSEAELKRITSGLGQAGPAKQRWCVFLRAKPAKTRNFPTLIEEIQKIQQLARIPNQERFVGTNLFLRRDIQADNVRDDDAVL